MTVDPMLACPLDIDKVSTKAVGYYMEPKQDGWRCIAQMENGVLTLSSRTGKPFQDKVHPTLIDQFEALGDNYILDGELGYVSYVSHDKFDYTLMTNEDYHKTASCLGSGPDVAQFKVNELFDNGQEMWYVAFDLLQAGGVPLFETPQGVRTDAMQRMLEDAWLKGDTSTVLGINQYRGWDESVYDSLVAAGAEGVMLKNPLQTYKQGKRPANHWFKVKKFSTMDVIITDYIPGEGKYQGQIGSLLFSLWDSEQQKPGMPVGACSGMDDTMRHYISNNWTHYKGQVMEVKFFGKVGAEGKGLRHPQFMRLRPDKLPEQCVLDE